MTPLNASSIHPNDVWWITLIKVLGVFMLQLLWCLFNVWFMRRVLGKMQNRKGPIMNSPGGLLQAIGDGMKLLFKETFVPNGTDKLIFKLAPVIAGVCAFTPWAVIPLAGEVRMFGQTTHLQVTDLPVAVLFTLATGSMAVYGLVLAGWSSDNSYSLLGGLRASAQMISYEVAMGLSLVAVFLMSGTMSTSQIVEAQAAHLNFFGMSVPLPSWYALVLFPSFCVYFISILAESNTPPFDLSECEQELVSGYSTEYTGFRYGTYYLAEFIHMATLSALAVTLFFGGYRAPFPFNMIESIDQGWWGLLWFFLKTQVMIFCLIWCRGALPRFRYDQFMGIGWKRLIPFSLAWIVMVTLMKATMGAEGNARVVLAGIMGVLCLLLLAWLLLGGEPEHTTEIDDEGDFDAFAGGYPVPPMPGQALPTATPVVSAQRARLDDDLADKNGVDA
ncbi:NADH-quinone oxidoreductase subunit NuoH [Luteococcus japonicus]|uniref:NADH-quinone oxidoreductase subunit H n=1 Tax=Luteococcus japonicus LSP_Lj1 TaxID=1255658 RepID=A0A1R4J2L9_9ACTN|nr:NADH-quinone oxidoreductase subunit NuoH [Luteococcus japonicus]SJN26380.1 NADH-ubiquinone oxidoreductase chain H [Luteococcus japonicus LSP_Lj1]